MKKEEDLELREMKLDEGCELKAVSIVTDPAIGKSFQYFNKVKTEVFMASEERQEITGPAMVPDLAMLRYDEKEKKYYNAFFTAETVKKCSVDYLKNSNHLQANFEHMQDNFTDQLFVIESWVVEDPELDKSKALGFTDVTKGTWFLTYKVADKELWSKLKQSEFTGFSIEASLNVYSEKYSAVENKIYNIVNSNLSDEDKERLIKGIISTI